MVKRPLCLFVLLFILALWLASLGGLFSEESPKGSLKPFLQGEKQVIIYGEVQRWENYDTAQYLYLKNAILPDSGQQIPLQGVQVKSEECNQWSPGNEVCAQGFLRLPQEADNPGQFDRRSYDRLRGISYVLEDARATLMRDTRDRGACILLDVKNWLKQGISRAFPEKSANLLQAMLLGEKGSVSQETKLLYQISSISHLLAISGLHVSLLGEGIRRSLQFLGIGVYGAYVGALLFLLPYTFLVGGSISALRAVILFGMGAGARILGRTYDLLSALALAAFLILIQEPGWLYDSSFLLSFGAVLGITLVRNSLFAPQSGRKQGKGVREDILWRRRFLEIWYQISLGIKEGACTGVALWLTVLPVVLYFFYEVSFYGILINLFVVPTAGIVLGCGFLGGILAGTGFLYWLGKIAAFPAVLLLELYERVARFISCLPYSTVILGRPNWIMIWGYYGILLFLCSWRKLQKNTEKRKGFLRGLAQGGLLVGSLGLFLGHPGTGVKVAMLDVGQGDGLVITTGWGSCYLIDGGSSSVYQVGRYRILPYLKYQGVQKIDMCILSHPDEDHVNGLLELLQMVENRETSLKIERILLPGWMMGSKGEQQLCQAASKAGADVQYVWRGDRIQDRQLSLQILHPDEKNYQMDTNGGSLSFLLEYRRKRGLFTGDLTGEQEEKLLPWLTPCDFLKVSHHGSASSTGEALLRVLQPKLALISSGANNPYGHPSPETIKRLEAVDSYCLETRELGAVELSLEPQKLQAKWMHPQGKI